MAKSGWPSPLTLPMCLGLPQLSRERMPATSNPSRPWPPFSGSSDEMSTTGGNGLALAVVVSSSARVATP